MDQDPTVTYNTAGTYQVTLIASNEGGSDALTKTDFITVNPATSSVHQDNARGNNIHIYPNPTRGYVYIEANQIKKVKVYSLNGVLLLEKTDVTNLLNVSHLRSGSYIIEVTKENDFVSREILNITM
jgi:hypothetical protein